MICDAFYLLSRSGPGGVRGLGAAAFLWAFPLGPAGTVHVHVPAPRAPAPVLFSCGLLEPLRVVSTASWSSR